MLDKLSKYIIDNKLFTREDTLIIGLSGGIDSMVMVHALTTLGYHPTVAHCNFGLRNKESDADEDFVKEFCKTHSIPFYTKRFDTLNYSLKNGISIQMAARELRYLWFEELCELYGFTKIVISHNANDQVETFFINILRGSGLRGLHGMKPINEKIVRPMLSIFRTEIESYQTKNSISFREDSSNSSDKYLRNNLRHNLLPAFTNIDKNFLHRICSSMENLLQSQYFIDKELEKYRQIKYDHEGNILIEIGNWIFEANSEYILFQILAEYGFNNSQILDLKNALILGKRNKQFISSTYLLYTSLNQIIIKSKKENITNILFEKEIHESDCSIISPIQLNFERMDSINYQEHSQFDSNIAYVDYDKLKFPVILRKWRKGDKFIPFGMKSNKKISDFMIDQKFTQIEKENCWLLCNNNQQIIWVIGYRTSNVFKVEKESKNIFKIKYNGIN